MAKAAMWRKRVAAFEASGLSRRDWCLRHRVALSSLDYWRRRLREAGPAPSGALVPVVVDGPMRSPIEIAVEGARIRLPVDVDAAWLCRVLRGLR
ncbi:MAG: hypothetical protein LW835_17945 [Burkholderiaceae bacterium]|jgi:hypothetical protein|nr:hypothetical protein [Burkholderiaceae bacterium]